MAEITNTALTGITCDRPNCPRRVNFEQVLWGTHLDTSHYAVPKLIEEGWSLWVGQRNRRTYCPEHGPTVPMRRMW
ncbi:hypothetical protein KNU02_gp69 [Gordonia phage Pleakley]|uniref:Uncharacterized protein n=1 Tax=Gordonia phage Pleakley TaxID=2283246 RepID=A0A345M6I7_9CAUD|nr:hypothetical protein KNU02_gp69 [Gordonia phage Pleakley]AXH49794.1 hypothetical protein SEA_FURY_69 [Gordonia phage Fury]AXH66108.1 hypothetical protein SEA_PLEAKLEY_69 [Gordonia phage Pleakley]